MSPDDPHPERTDRYTAEASGPTGSSPTTSTTRSPPRTPDQVAAVTPRETITYGELARRSVRVALGLLELGVRPGDVVSYQLPNWIEFLVLHHAATRIGAVNNPLIPIYRDREVGFMVGLAESKVLVVPQEFRGYDYPAMVERLRPQWPALQHVLVVGLRSTRSWEEFAATPWEERRDPAELAALRPDPNDVTLLIFTSGTTGEPKGVLHSHNTLMAANAPLPDRLGVGPDDVIHMASTFAHLTGFLYGVRLPVQVGGATAVYQEVWDPEQFTELVEQHRITYTSAATPFLHDTLNTPSSATRDLSSPAAVLLHGRADPAGHRPRGAPAAARPDRARRLGAERERAGHPGHPGRPRGEDRRARRLSVSRAWRSGSSTTTACRCPPAGGPRAGARAVPVRRLPARPELTAASFDGDWFDTGDVAEIDADGYLNITGRTKDVIIRGGENIPVAYVENVLYEHPDVAAVALVGLPDPRLQERACAVSRAEDRRGGFTMETCARSSARRAWPGSTGPSGWSCSPELPRTRQRQDPQVRAARPVGGAS